MYLFGVHFAFKLEVMLNEQVVLSGVPHPDGPDSNPCTPSQLPAPSEVPGGCSPSPRRMGSLPPANWVERLKVPLPSMPTEFQRALMDKARPQKPHLNKFVRALVTNLMEVIAHPTIEHCRQLAQRLVDAHKESLGDFLSGEVVGSGFASLAQQIKWRVEEVTRSTHTRLRRYYLLFPISF